MDTQSIKGGGLSLATVKEWSLFLKPQTGGTLIGATLSHQGTLLKVNSPLQNKQGQIPPTFTASCEIWHFQ